jgi:hypothetical protein
MAKKNSGKVVQMLSPINYIRTKARTLPLYECWINTNWEEISQASCIVSRKHSNGNITYCFYFVDLLCLGVDLTYFKFNEPLSEYKDYLVQAEEELSFELVLVDYALVHNVIHAGIQYAEEFEFKAHKDFTSITQFFLEEDNDDIEFMEIECGDDDGQPVYLYSSLKTNPREKDRIIAQLERTAGPDNYTIIDLDDTTDEDDFEDDFEDNFEDLDDIYYQNTFEQNREIFIEMYDELKDSDNPFLLTRLTQVTDALFFEIADEALVEQYYDELFDRLSINLEFEGRISNEFLGVKPEVQISDQVSDLFMTVFINIHRNFKKARKGLELLKMEAGVIPSVAFLELLILQNENSDKYDEILQKYNAAYSDYPLITLLGLINMYSSGNVTEKIADKSFNLETLFPGRDSLHHLEMLYYLLFISSKVAYERDADKMEAFYEVLDDIDLPEDTSKIVRDLFSIPRIEYLFDYINLENNEWK